MSKPKQKHIKRMLLMGFIQNIVAVVFIVLAVFSIFSVLAQMFLQSYFADVALQSIRTQNPTKQINERVLSINETVRASHAIQAQYHAWSPILVLIANTIPDSIEIHHIQLHYATKQLQLSGVAPSREALLELKAHLESLDAIAMVDIPLRDLTTHDQINFSLSIPFVF